MAYIGPDAVETEPVETDTVGSLGSLILPELPQCNDLIIRQQLAYALREFCRETNACIVEAPTHAEWEFDYRGQRFPIPPPPKDMVVGSVLDLKADGHSVPFEVCDLPHPHVYVLPCLCISDWATIRFAVYPKAGSERCPTWFKDRYAEAITAGAMHNLLSMSNRPWSDPSRAAQYAAKYADAIAEASYRSLGSAAQGGPESAIPCGGLFM